jgi:hypothetical protein
MRTQVLYAREPRWREIAERAEELMKGPGFRPVKSEGRKVAGVLTLADGSSVFLKKSQSSSWLRGIVMPLAGSPAIRALRGAALLDAAEIPHPRPLAASQAVGRGGAVRASYLVSEALLKGETLSEFALGPGEIKGRDARRRRRILDTVAREVRRLHDAGLYTRDLQETNVMVAEGRAANFACGSSTWRISGARSVALRGTGCATWSISIAASDGFSAAPRGWPFCTHTWAANPIAWRCVEW